MIGLATVSLAEEPNKELVGLIINLLSDPDKDVRGLGFDQVRSEAKGSAATERFSAQLPKLSHDAQAGLLSALADRGDPAARPGVRELLSASDSEPSEEKGTGVIS
jgi:HEAT repeat protein